jgi:putative pyrroloquinoline-quinone binding quinoprotein
MPNVARRRWLASVLALGAGALGALSSASVALGTLATGSPIRMCQALNPDVTDPSAVGDARRVMDILVVGDTVYLAGKFTALMSPDAQASVARNHLGACSLSTGEVLPWNPSPNGWVFSLATDGNSIYAGGQFTTVGGAPHLGLVAIDPVSGTPAPSGPGVTAGSVRAMAFNGGTLYVGGTFKQANGVNRNTLAAFNTSDGKLLSWDPAKDFDPLNTTFEVRALVHWGSKVVIGEYGDNPMDNLWAVDDTTGAKLTWKKAPTQSDPVLGLAVSGSRVFTAIAGSGGEVRSFDLANGAQQWDVKFDGNVQAIWANGDIVYAGGHMEFLKDGSVTPRPIHRAVALDANTGDILAWNPAPDNVGNGLYAVEGGAGSLLLGGEFTWMGGRYQPGISRFLADFVPPTISSVAGTLAPGGPRPVTVTGSGLAGTSVLNLGPGIALTSVTVLSPTQIQATATVDMSAKAGPRGAVVVSDGMTAVCTSCLTVSGTTGPQPIDGGGGTIDAGPGGYRLVAQDGGIFAFGDAQFKGSTGAIKLVQPIVSMTSTPSGQGYWLTAADGGIFAFGDAQFKGSTGAIKLAQPIVAMTATPSGLGYWLTARDGGIFAFGDASFKGSTGAIKLAQPIVGMTATPSGQGYWLVAADGGIFAFGDAQFKGSTGAIKLARPIIGMTVTKSGQGYWMVASDGGIFAFGDAQFKGSTGAIKLVKPIVGIASTASGDGYWMVASDGGIFAFGDAVFKGSTGGITLAQPIVGMARS